LERSLEVNWFLFFEKRLNNGFSSSIDRYVFRYFKKQIILNLINKIFEVGNENVLEQALRTYEESERSLKSICNSVEQENNQLENQLKSLQIQQTTSIKQYHLLKERVHQIRGEHARLAERQIIFDQQTKLIHQRFFIFHIFYK
jgi:hypothetical protein